jgi:hypothetical protein
LEARVFSFIGEQGGRGVRGEGDSCAATPAMERGRRGQGEVGEVSAVLGRLLARWGTAW